MLQHRVFYSAGVVLTSGACSGHRRDQLQELAKHEARGTQINTAAALARLGSVARPAWPLRAASCLAGRDFTVLFRPPQSDVFDPPAALHPAPPPLRHSRLSLSTAHLLGPISWRSKCWGPVAHTPVTVHADCLAPAIISPRE